MNKKRCLTALTVLWILCIWGHSMMPGDISGSESGVITDFLELFLGEKENLELYVRKAAHFTEYAVLGVLLASDLYTWWGEIKGKITFALTAILFVPFVDETIQIFAVNRNSAVTDMWIDVSGAVLGFGVAAVLLGKRLKLKD